MESEPSHERLNRKIIDSLYVEAMVLADEARSYFDRAKDDGIFQGSPLLRITLSCESIKVTTRLMNIVSWLLTRRTHFSGARGVQPAQFQKLSHAPTSARQGLVGLPDEAQIIIEASVDLYARIARIDHDRDLQPLVASPVRSLLRQIESAF